MRLGNSQPQESASKVTIMKSKEKTNCDKRLLDEYLDARLDDESSELMESHLTECRECQRRIEQLGFDLSDWSRKQSLLLPDAIDSQLLFATKSDGASPSNEMSMLTREIRGWLDATDDPRMLGRFAGYEIVGIVGHGGMGIVLKGFEASLNRYVAIKILAPRLATNGSARNRFSREAQAAAAVRHDNVIAIHRVDQWHGLPFLVMPYAGGISLQKRIDSDGRLTIEQTLRVGIQVASGLAAAHAQGLVHRDIKPANILLEQGVERVTITDFGLARAADDASITRTGVIAGTPQYMSPEQAEAGSLDARSDLFSLGSVLYTMATGRPPFRGESSYEVLRRIVTEPVRPMREIESSVPEWFAWLVSRLHAKSPNDRPSTASEVASLLEACLAHVQQPMTKALPAMLADDIAEKTAAQPRRHLAIIHWITGVAFSCLAVFAGVLVLLELNKEMAATKSEAGNLQADIRGGDDPSQSVQHHYPQAANLSQPQLDPKVQVPLAGDASLDWSVSPSLVVSMEEALQQVESQLEGTGAVAILMQQERLALSKVGPVVRYTIKVLTTGDGTSPKPGDWIDINVCLHEFDPFNPDVVPLLRTVRVVGTTDDRPENTLNRLIAIELELTQIETDRVRFHESRNLFTFSPSATSH